MFTPSIQHANWRKSSRHKKYVINKTQCLSSRKARKKIIDNSQENIKILAFGNSYLYSNWNLNKYDINIFNFLLLQVFFCQSSYQTFPPRELIHTYILTFLYILSVKNSKLLPNNWMDRWSLYNVFLKAEFLIKKVIINSDTSFRTNEIQFIFFLLINGHLQHWKLLT